LEISSHHLNFGSHPHLDLDPENVRILFTIVEYKRLNEFLFLLDGLSAASSYEIFDGEKSHTEESI